ncbi:MAG TPA: flagellar assembly protein FliW [Actinobacteria bacterium]|mgnify:CR=1 FL=1|nr:flagellar assembly protein FliW [Actinomycetota bacterium]
MEQVKSEAKIEKIKTTRFGEIEIDKDKIINFTESLPGLPESQKFILLPHKEESPFMWFQSTELPDLAFIVMNPCQYLDNYEPKVAIDDLSILGFENFPDSGALLLGLVSIPDDPKEMTINLMAPIILNLNSKTAKQVVLENEDYPIKHRIFTED